MGIESCLILSLSSGPRELSVFMTLARSRLWSWLRPASFKIHRFVNRDVSFHHRTPRPVVFSLRDESPFIRAQNLWLSPPGDNGLVSLAVAQAASHPIDAKLTHRDSAGLQPQSSRVGGTSPLTQTIRVPVLLAVRSRRPSAPPMAMMCFTWQKVSTYSRPSATGRDRAPPENKEV